MNKQDIVYVVYLDDELYQYNGRKCAYLKIGSARQVISADSKKIAQVMCEDDNKCWWDLSKEEQKEWVSKARERFEIKEFVEKQ